LEAILVGHFLIETYA